MTQSAGKTFGLTLAFNSIGWKSQNLLFNAVDAFLGDPVIGNAFGNQDPALVQAHIIDSAVTAAGGVTVTGLNEAVINAETTNNTQMICIMTTGSSGWGAGIVIAKNLVNIETSAIVEETGSTRGTLRAGGAVAVTTEELAEISADTFMRQLTQSINDFGLSAAAGLLQAALASYQYTTKSGTRTLDNGDLVRVGDDHVPAGFTAGTVGTQMVAVDGTTVVAVPTGYTKGGTPGTNYRYTGAPGTIDLNAQYYWDVTRWIPVTGVFMWAGADMTEPVDLGTQTYDADHGWAPVFVDAALSFLAKYSAWWGGFLSGGVDGQGVGLIFVTNDVRGGVTSAIRNITVTAPAGVTVTALETATIRATDISSVVVEATSGWALNVMAATNVVLSSATAEITGSAVAATGGGIVVGAQNTSTISADVTSRTQAANTGVGITLAFNSIGWDSQNIFFNALDAVAGDVLGDENPAATTARVTGSTLTAGGAVSVTATTAAAITSHVKSSVLTVAISTLPKPPDPPPPADEKKPAEEEKKAEEPTKPPEPKSLKAISVGTVIAMNRVSTLTQALISDAPAVAGAPSVSAGGTLTVAATDSATITSTVSAPAIAVSVDLGTNPDTKGAVSVTVALSVARNEVRTATDAAITAVPWVRAGGNVVVTAAETAAIDATSTASAVSVSASTSGKATSFAGGGASAINIIAGHTAAAITGGQVVSTNGSITIATTNSSAITALIAAIAASLAVSAGGRTAGVAIGVSVARNLIGWTEWRGADPIGVTARATDTSLTAAGVTISAGSTAVINATVAAMSVAISASTSDAHAVSVGGLWTDNRIATLIEASATRTAIAAGTGAFTVTATDSSHITADAMAAAVAASLSGGKGGAGSVGVSLAHNTVDNDVVAFVREAGTVTAGNVTITATSDAAIIVRSVAAALSVAIAGGTPAVAFAGGGAESTNVVLSSTSAYVVGGSLGSPTAKVGAVTITATSGGVVEATVVAVAASVSVGGTDSAAFALGISVARNFIGWDPYADVEYDHLSTDRPDTLVAGETVLVVDGPRAGDVYVYTGPSLDDPPYDYLSTDVVEGGIAWNTRVKAADGTVYRWVPSFHQFSSDIVSWLPDGRIVYNVETGKFYQRVGNLGPDDPTHPELGVDLSKQLYDCGGVACPGWTLVNPTDLSDAGNNATGGVNDGNWILLTGVELETQDYGDVTLWLPGSLTARPAAVVALVDGASVHATGGLTLTATSTQRIDAVVLAGAVAIGGGGTTGIAASGAGAYAENRIATDVRARIDGVPGDTLTTLIRAASLTMTATDASAIKAVVGAAAISIAVGGATGVAVAIGLSLALNEVANAVEAAIRNADVATTSGGVSLAVDSAGIPLFQRPQATWLTPADLDDAAVADSDDLTTTNVNEAAVDAAGDQPTRNVLVGIFVARGAPLVSGWTLDLLRPGQAWRITSGQDVYLITLITTGPDAGKLQFWAPTIDAISVGAALAAGFAGTTGFAVAGAGAVALNAVTSTANAHIDDSAVDSGGAIGIQAMATKAITATILALSLATGAGSTTGVGISIGVAIAKNVIGEALDGTAAPSQVRAYTVRSALVARGALTLRALASHTISALVISASAAVAVGGTAGVAASGAGVWAENLVAAHVAAFIDGSGATGIRARSAELTARDLSTISAIVGAASLAFAFGGTGGVAVAIGVSLARNTIANEVAASIANATVTTTPGGVTLTALEDAGIRAVSAAAALAVGAGGFGAGVAGAGAWARNEITTATTAAITDSTITTAGAVSLSATDTSTVTALIAAVALAVGAGGGGLGVAIGGAVAENIIATVTAALITGSTITRTAVGVDVGLVAETEQAIDALVLAGSMAIAAGGGAVGVGASGAAAKNSITAQTTARIEGGSVGTAAAPVRAITINAFDRSLINAITGAASIAGSFGGTGVAVAIGVALAWNRIAGDVEAAIVNAAVVASGAVNIAAEEFAQIKAWTAAASLAVAVGGLAAGVSGAGAQATNIILSAINAHVDGGSMRSTGDITIEATNDATIEAKVLAVAAAAGVGGTGIGVALGAAVARNYIGWEPGSVAEPAHQSTDTPLSVVAGDVVQIVTGARTGDFYEYVGAAPLTNADGSALDLTVQEYGDTSLWRLVGAYDRAQVRASILGATRVEADDLILTADATQTIDAVVLTGAVALTGGGAGVGVSGAGVYAENRIAADVKAFVDGDDPTTEAVETTTVDVGSVTITATDASGIHAVAGAAAIAAAIGGVGVAVSIGLSIAINEVANDVAAFITHATVDADRDVVLAAGAAGRTLFELSGVTAAQLDDAATADPDDPETDDEDPLTTADDEAAVDAADDAVILTALADAFAAAGYPLPTDVVLSAIATGESWLVVSGLDTYVITRTGDTLTVSRPTIGAITAAASVAAGLGAIGVAVSGAGAIAENTVLSTATASLDASTVTRAGNVDLDASATSSIVAVIAAASAAIGIGVTGAGVGASIGISIARNTIGGANPADGPVIPEVGAFLRNTSVATSGALTLDAVGSQIIAALVTAMSTAVGGGAAAGVGMSGAGVWAENTIASDVQSFIAATTPVTVRAAGIALTASDTSAIAALAGSASLAAGIGTVGVAISIGVTLARNTISSDVAAYTANAAVTASGSTGLAITATNAASIAATSAAASAALGAGFTGVAVSGAGAQATNVILTRTDASVSGGSVTSAGAITITATSTAAIRALVGAVSAALGAGAGGVGVALGASVARNLIGWEQAGVEDPEYRSTDHPTTVVTGDVVAVVTGARSGDFYEYVGEVALVAAGGLDLTTQEYGDTSLWKQVGLEQRAAQIRAFITGATRVSAPAGALTLSATSTATIDALVVSAAVAIAGGAVGIGFSGAGVAALNRIVTDVQAYLDGDTVVTVVGTASISITATDNSAISAFAGAAAITFAVGAVSGAVSFGLAIASNEVANDVAAYLAHASVTTGDLVITATAAGGTLFELTGVTVGQLDDGDNPDTLAALDAAFTLAGHDLRAGTVVSTIAAGTSWLVVSGVDVYVITLVGESLIVSRPTIGAVAAAASVAAAVGLEGVAVSGAGAVAENTVLSTANAYLDASTVTQAAAVDLDATSTSSVVATVVAASAAVGAGLGAGVGVSIGISFARNTIGAAVEDAGALPEVGAFLRDTSVTASGAVTLDAVAGQVIAALVTAMSAAVGAGGVAGVGFSGSGVWAENSVFSDVEAFIATTTTATVTAASVALHAADTSAIAATAGSASIAAALGSAAGVSLSFGTTLARNTIATDVLAFIAKATVIATGSSGITVTATNAGSITALAAAASLAAGFSLGAGVGVSGAGADAANVILTRTNAYASGASLTSAGVVTFRATSTATIDALVGAASAAVGAGFVGAGASIGLSLARNTIGWTPAAVSGTILSSDGELTTDLTAGTQVRITTGPGAGGVYRYVGPTITFDGETPLDLKAQDYQNTELWLLVSLAPSPAEVRAYADGTSVSATGALTFSATSAETIAATVLAGSAALSGGVVGIGLSGAGAAAVNRITIRVQSGVDDGGGATLAAGSITVTASGDPTITATTEAVSLAEAVGVVSVAVSIGAAVARNEIAGEVEAVLTNVTVTTAGDVSVTVTTTRPGSRPVSPAPARRPPTSSSRRPPRTSMAAASPPTTSPWPRPPPPASPPRCSRPRCPWPPPRWRSACPSARPSPRTSSAGSWTAPRTRPRCAPTSSRPPSPPPGH